MYDLRRSGRFELVLHLHVSLNNVVKLFRVIGTNRAKTFIKHHVFKMKKNTSKQPIMRSVAPSSTKYYECISNVGNVESHDVRHRISKLPIVTSPRFSRSGRNILSLLVFRNMPYPYIYFLNVFPSFFLN